MVFVCLITRKNSQVQADLKKEVDKSRYPEFWIDREWTFFAAGVLVAAARLACSCGDGPTNGNINHTIDLVVALDIAPQIQRLIALLFVM